MDLDKVKALIPVYPDFPKKGVVFYDIHPVMQNDAAREFLVDRLAARYEGKVDIVVGLESRGYYFGILLAQRLKIAFVPCRKAGKLPGSTIKLSYGKEYGTDIIEVQKDNIPEGSRVVIVDDLLATGGTASAAISLIQNCGATIIEFHVQIELLDLKGRDKLPQNVSLFSFFQV